jgi:hypothetical protein
VSETRLASARGFGFANGFLGRQAEADRDGTTENYLGLLFDSCADEATSDVRADLAKWKAVAAQLNAALAPIVFVFDETDKHGGLIQFEALERASAALRAYRELTNPK